MAEIGLSLAGKSVPTIVERAVAPQVGKLLSTKLIQDGLTDAFTSIENTLSTESRIATPPLVLYPKSVYFREGNVCFRGAYCIGICPDDDDPATRCISEHSAYISAKKAYDRARDLCVPGEVKGGGICGSVGRLANAYYAAKAPYLNCLEPACDPAHATAY